MATYVVGDIHGCFREWINFKSKIERQDPAAEFVLVGDILDKGPHSMEMLGWAMERITPGGKYQMVVGNHETEKIEWLKYVFLYQAKEQWKDAEIARRMLSADGFGFYKACLERKKDSLQLKTILEWLETLPVYIEKNIETTVGRQKFRIVHQPKAETNEKQESATITIHGHIPTTLEPCKGQGAIPGKIWVRKNSINVDCGLVYGVTKSKGLFGDLAAICLEDFREFYYYNHVF